MGFGGVAAPGDYQKKSVGLEKQAFFYCGNN
jgi:hypothetical protein